MSPKLQAVKDALARVDRAPQWGARHEGARKDLLKAVHAAGFCSARAAEDWARYQVAVGEAAEQIEVTEEPDPEQQGLFA